MEVIRKLTTKGAKASSVPSNMETRTDSIINKALTSNALPTFEDIAFIFIRSKDIKYSSFILYFTQKMYFRKQYVDPYRPEHRWKGWMNFEAVVSILNLWR